MEQRKEDRRFIAEMTAYQMNCWIDKNHRITGADLLGEKESKKRKSFAEMDESERAATLEAIENRGKQKSNPA